MSKNLTLKGLLVLFLLSMVCQTTYAQISNLLFNSYTNITIMNFDTEPPVISYTDNSGFEGIAHAEDGDGTILFYIIANGVYRPDGTLMPGSAGLNADPSSAEMNICLVPGETDKYYILYQLFEACDPLEYSIVDMSLAGGLGDVATLNVQFDAADHAEGMEVVRIPGTDEYWYLAYKCYTGIDRYKIDASGISAATDILPIVPLATGFYDGRMELDYHDGKIAWGFNGKNQGFIANFDPLTGVASDLITIDDINPFGAEFSLEGNKAYFVEWYDTGTDNVFQYDIATSTLTPYQVIPLGCGGGTGGGLGQIELGGDGHLYIIHDNGCGITRIEDADTDTPIFVPIPVDYSLALGISDHIQSDVVPELTFTYNEETLFIECYGEETGSIEITIESGEPPFDIQWSHDPGNTSLTLNDLPAGTYILDISDANDTAIHEEFTITQPDLLVIDVDVVQPLCFGEAGRASVGIIGGTPPYTIDWHDINPEFVPINTHVVTVTDAYGCIAEAEYTIIEPTQLEAVITTKDALCFEGYGSVSIEVSGATPPYDIDWKGADTERLFTGEYEYSVTDANGCSIEGTYFIDEAEMLDFDVVFDQQDCNDLTGRSTTTVTGGTAPYDVNWFGFDTEDLSPGTYEVEVTDANGCSRKEEFFYDAIKAKVFTPTTFSPNHDGLNELFLPSVDCYTSFEVTVFDRWGKLVFQSTSKNKKWDGTFKGTALPSAMYVYKLKVRDAAYQLKEHSGYVLLMR